MENKDASQTSKKFWGSAWASEKWTKGTELITIHMQRTAIDFSYAMMGDLQGKTVLEVGCGSGLQAVELAQKGAKVTAIDLSESSVATVAKIADETDLPIMVKQMNAEAMSFVDESFDVVYINCVLMHVDQEKVLSEGMRVLQKGGKLVFKENIEQWLFRFPYRTFSPYDTMKPKYVSVKQIQNFGAEHKEFYLFSTFFLFLFYVLKKSRFPGWLFNTIAVWDSKVLKHLPFLRQVSWVTVAWKQKI